MKKIEKYYKLLTSLILAVATFTSCEWDKSPEYDHPTCVTYAISSGILSFEGPEQLQRDILAWIKENSIDYDKEVSYSTGEASEFAKTDAEAIKKYNEEYLPKFKSYLDELRRKLGLGTYGELPNGKVRILFYTTASRTQGQGGNLKYEQFEFNYPEP